MAGTDSELLTRHRADIGDGMFGAVRRLRWSAERLHAERERKLRELLAWAAEHSPFHAQRLAGIDVSTFTEADLPALPIMTRDELTDRFDEVVTDPKLSLDVLGAHLEGPDSDGYLFDRYRVFRTSGTTGGRVLFVYDWDEWTTFVTMANRWRGRDGYELPLDAPIASVFASSTKHISGALHVFSRSDTADAPAVTHLPPTLPLPEIVAGLNAAPPVVLQGYPSSIGMLALEAVAGRLRIDPQRILTCGEQCTDATRLAVADAWSLEIDDYWGCSEGAYAFPCEARDGMHLPDDLVIVEPVDRDGNAVEPGRPAAKILLTNLYNRTQPLIRYEITDALTLRNDVCACGCAHRRITDLAGRDETLFVYDDGAVVHSLGIEVVLLGARNLAGFQVTQTRRGVDISIVAKGDCDFERIRRGVVDVMAGSGVPDAEVRIRVVPALDLLWSGKVSKFRAL